MQELRFMRKGLMLPALLLLTLGLLLAPNVHASVATTTNQSPSSATHSLYWFQVGAWATNANGGYSDNFGIPITGTSVDIQVNINPRNIYPNGGLYWVGINLPNDAFIQVGYEDSLTGGWSTTFWEYFPQGHAAEDNVGFLGGVGNIIGPNATWHHFTLTSSGTRWTAYVDNAKLGSVDMGQGDSDSGGAGPYAVAEAPGVAEAVHLGPVEFRALQYRDASGIWHSAPSAVSLCCYATRSYKLQGTYPYGVQGISGHNNTWLAGSDLTNAVSEEGDYLWPWYQVNVQGLPDGYSFPNGWYVYDSTIDLTNMPQILDMTGTSRMNLEGWYVNGVPENLADSSILTVTGNLMLKPEYVKQYLVQVNSQLATPIGTGWYNGGATATISVTPTFIPLGVLGSFGVGSTFTGWQGSAVPVSGGMSKVHVDGPMRFTAVWQPTFGVLPYYALLIIPALGLLIYRRRLSRTTA